MDNTLETTKTSNMQTPVAPTISTSDTKPRDFLEKEVSHETEIYTSDSKDTEIKDDEKITADKLLEIIKTNGIDEGFNVLSNGQLIKQNNNQDLEIKQDQEKSNELEETKQYENTISKFEEKYKNPNLTQEIQIQELEKDIQSLKNENTILSGKLVEVSEKLKQMEDVLDQITNILIELTKLQAEKEENEKNKQSLLQMLIALTNILLTEIIIPENSKTNKNKGLGDIGEVII